jgi:hypothetical protein
MKQIAPNYTYNKTTGVITLTGVNIDRDQLLLIVNTTRNVIYYNFADSTTTLQSFSSNATPTSITLNSSVISASSAHANTDALTIYYDDQSTSNLATAVQDGIAGWAYDAGGDGSAPIHVTANEGGETPTSDTATLTNDTRWELNTEGFGHVALEIVSTGVTWSSNGVVAQAYNGTAPSNADIFAPAGIRYRHSNDTSVAPTSALNNIYYNLGIGPTVGNGFGTNLVRVDGSNAGLLVLPTTGTRYFLFDLTTSRFAIRPFFSAGTVQVKYRLYRGKHPFFSARNIVATGDGTAGAVRVESVGGSVGVYVDGGYLDQVTANVFGLDAVNQENKAVPVCEPGDLSVQGVIIPVGIQSGTVSISNRPDQGATGQGTVASFTSTTSAVLKASNSDRKLLTVFNEGSGTLFILLGSGTASTTNYSLRILSGDYYELEKYTGEVNAIFGSAGTARITEIT